MAVPHISTNFGDILDPQFSRIFDEEFTQLPDRVSDFYTIVGSGPRGGREGTGRSGVRSERCRT